MLFPPEDVVTISREEWRVCRFARPPDQATRSGNDLILFKKISFKFLQMLLSPPAETEQTEKGSHPEDGSLLARKEGFEEDRMRFL
jgi:hypothetical protein